MGGGAPCCEDDGLNRRVESLGPLPAVISRHVDQCDACQAAQADCDPSGFELHREHLA